MVPGIVELPAETWASVVAVDEARKRLEEKYRP
jgi:hypothetical protein